MQLKCKDKYQCSAAFSKSDVVFVVLRVTKVPESQGLESAVFGSLTVLESYNVYQRAAGQIHDVQGGARLSACVCVGVTTGPSVC